MLAPIIEFLNAINYPASIFAVMNPTLSTPRGISKIYYAGLVRKTGYYSLLHFTKHYFFHAEY